MKLLTQSIRLTFLLLSAIALLTISSCKKDDPKEGCTDAAAENFDMSAENDNGTCTYARTKFIGNYNANENCDSGNYTYVTVVTESTAGVDQIVINNLGNFGVNVRAVVSGSNININDTQGGINFSGSGSISDNTLTIIYTASAGGSTDSCTATCIKQ